MGSHLASIPRRAAQMTLIKSSNYIRSQTVQRLHFTVQAWFEADHMEVFISDLQQINLRPTSWSGINCSQYQIASNMSSVY